MVNPMIILLSSKNGAKAEMVQISTDKEMMEHISG